MFNSIYSQPLFVDTRRVSGKSSKDTYIKLLLVDHSERVRGAIIGGLCEAIYECADGAGAPAAYDEFHPDQVLIDIRMQHLDGPGNPSVTRPLA
ncbi:MAG TPA: hypothetical protein VJQ56_05595 [Blastocatellia bacterium]|nr:hypothetical protein [Blastocatellia bacterium]